MRNPYEVLGISPSARPDDIQKAYRKLAKKLHPDLNPGDKSAEERFKEVAGAYDLLSNPDKRARFDAGEIDETGKERQQKPYYRDYAGSDHEHHSSDAGFADFAAGTDPFAELVRRSAQARANRQGDDLHYRLAVSFFDAIKGGPQRITLPTGGTLDVTIPAGIINGQTLRLKGKGARSIGKGTAGDALIEIEVRSDPRFEREGDDIMIDVPVSLTEAVLGGKIQVPTPTGSVVMTVPAGSNSGSTLRLKGMGAPRNGGGRGDQFVKLNITLPKGHDDELEHFVSSWEAGKSFDPREASR